MRATGRILKLGVTAFCTDFSIYVIWVVIPYRAIDLGAGALYLGILPAIFSTTYILTTLLLVVSVLAAFWGAAKVFRLGILMTGKPPRLWEIWRIVFSRSD